MDPDSRQKHCTGNNHDGKLVPEIAHHLLAFCHQAKYEAELSDLRQQGAGINAVAPVFAHHPEHYRIDGTVYQQHHGYYEPDEQGMQLQKIYIDLQPDR